MSIRLTISDVVPHIKGLTVIFEHKGSTGKKTRTYERSYVRFYVLPNSCVRLYVFPNLYVRFYVLPNSYVSS